LLLLPLITYLEWNGAVDSELLQLQQLNF
jgi:hypothetical protein